MDEYVPLLAHHDGNGGQRTLRRSCHRLAVQVECTSMTGTSYAVAAELERTSCMRTAHGIGPQVRSFVTYENDGLACERQYTVMCRTEDLFDRTEIDGLRMPLCGGPYIACENGCDRSESRYARNADQYFSS